MIKSETGYVRQAIGTVVLTLAPTVIVFLGSAVSGGSGILDLLLTIALISGVGASAVALLRPLLAILTVLMAPVPVLLFSAIYPANDPAAIGYEALTAVAILIAAVFGAVIGAIAKSGSDRRLFWIAAVIVALQLVPLVLLRWAESLSLVWLAIGAIYHLPWSWIGEPLFSSTEIGPYPTFLGRIVTTGTYLMIVVVAWAARRGSRNQ